MLNAAADAGRWPYRDQTQGLKPARGFLADNSFEETVQIRCFRKQLATPSEREGS